MLSRVAENLYWISRYVERAESLARLLEDSYSMELEATPHESGPLDNALLILNVRERFEQHWEKSDPIPDSGIPRSIRERRDSVLGFLTFDRLCGSSILESIARARENARATQDAVSGEAWSQLNKLHLYLNSSRADERFAAGPARFLNRVRRECVLFAAIVDGTLPRTEAYHFLQVGRYLERVDMLSRVVNVHCHAAGCVPWRGPEEVEPAAPIAHWASLLRCASAYEAYLQQARERMDPVGVVRYLLLEAEFPRSMRFGVARCLDSLRAIAGGSGSGTEAERSLGRLDSELRYMDVDDLFRRGVGEFLVGVQDTCAAAGRHIHEAYFRT